MKSNQILQNLQIQWNQLHTSKKALVQFLVVLLFLLILKNLFAPKIREYREAKFSYEEVANKLNILNAELSVFDQVVETRERYLEKLDSLSVVFSNKVDISELLPSSSLKINLLEFEPKEMERSEGFTKVLLDLKVTGAYKELVKYMQFIEQAHVISYLDSFYLAPYPEQPSQTLAQISLSVYSGPETDSTLIFTSYWNGETEEGYDVKTEKARPLYIDFNYDPKYSRQRSRPVRRRQEPSLKITGAWLGRVPKLTVNGHVLRIGESISGWVLTAVDKEKRMALFSKNGVRRTVRF